MSNEAGNRYNIQLINALVLYVGTQAIAYIHNKGSTPSMSTITHSAHMDIFQNLAVDLDTEGKTHKHTHVRTTPLLPCRFKHRPLCDVGKYRRIIDSDR